jgi:hypothetical protein
LLICNEGTNGKKKGEKMQWTSGLTAIGDEAQWYKGIEISACGEGNATVT